MGGGRHIFSQIEHHFPLPYSSMPVRLLRDARPAGWANCFSICLSTMPTAQNRTAKGSILKEDETLCHSGYIIYLWLLCSTKGKSQQQRYTSTKVAFSNLARLTGELHYPPFQHVGQHVGQKILLLYLLPTFFQLSNFKIYSVLMTKIGGKFKHLLQL